MFSFLSEFLQKNEIKLFAPLPLSSCKVTKPYLLERAGITDGTVIMMAAPYFTKACLSPGRNISAYAVSQDYHAFFKQLFNSLTDKLREKYPQYRFAGFSDHSPILEIDAAAKAGLGVIGKNRLLITEEYSSYIFLGELITDAYIPSSANAVRCCENCGACVKACPAAVMGECLSSLTQKKGTLSAQEQDQIRTYGSAWGCDICQTVCPHTINALRRGTIYSPISFFNQNTISDLDERKILEIGHEEFACRAYSWRGKDTVLRNLHILEAKGESPC